MPRFRSPGRPPYALPVHRLSLTCRARGAFLLPVIAVVWASGFSADRPTGATLATVVIVCAAAGALWQLLHRRDLADRLTHFASGFTVACLFFFPMVWKASTSSSISGGFGLLAVFTGLVYAEQFLRWRAARSVRRRAVAVA